MTAAGSECAAFDSGEITRKGGNTAITQYQFEVLAHLEREGAEMYSLRGLSDTLAISGGEVSRCLD